MECRNKIRTMSCYDPEEERYHRYTEIKCLYSVHLSKSISKCEYDDDKLSDRKCECKHDRRSTPELVARDKYTDRRDLVEEPSDDIGLRLPTYDRVYIAEHRRIDEYGREDERDSVIGDIEEVCHTRIVSYLGFFCKKWESIY